MLYVLNKSFKEVLQIAAYNGFIYYITFRNIIDNIFFI